MQSLMALAEPLFEALGDVAKFCGTGRLGVGNEDKQGAAPAIQSDSSALLAELVHAEQRGPCSCQEGPQTMPQNGPKVWVGVYLEEEEGELCHAHVGSQPTVSRKLCATPIAMPRCNRPCNLNP